MTSLWIAYIAAALLVLLYKLARYCYQNRTRQRWQVVTEWFFEPTADNAVSWVATVGVVWTLGYLYVSQVISLIDGVPVHPSIAFLLGAVAEFVAPPVAKTITAKAIAVFGKVTGASNG